MPARLSRKNQAHGGRILYAQVDSLANHARGKLPDGLGAHASNVLSVLSWKRMPLCILL